MLNYLISSGNYATLNADYQPTLEEWMQLENRTTWEFYANHAFLQVSFNRDKNRMDLAKPGVYLINYQLKTDVEYFKSFVDPVQRNNWKALLPAELKVIAARRHLLETELAGRGILIDKEYRDPPLPE